MNWMFISLIYILKALPKYDGGKKYGPGGWLGHEGEAIKGETSAILKGTPKSFLILSPCEGTSGKGPSPAC